MFWHKRVVMKGGALNASEIIMKHAAGEKRNIVRHKSSTAHSACLSSSGSITWRRCSGGSVAAVTSPVQAPGSGVARQRACVALSMAGEEGELAGMVLRKGAAW